MRLFHTKVQVEWEILIITQERVLKHAKVLRLNVWDTIAVQQQDENSTTRRSWQILELDKVKITLKIISNDTVSHSDEWPWMLIWMPNSNEKLHTVVQKLTEIWIQDIVFWKNDWSQGLEISDKKMSKLCKISLEAIEQSNWRKAPTISQVSNIHERVVWKELVLFDFEWESYSELSGMPKDRLYWVVWPEWHFSPRDYETIWFQIVKKINLWDSILRTETAAIVASWFLKNI